MKIVQIKEGRVHWITPYKPFEEIPPFAPDIVLVEAPDEVNEGWLYVDGGFRQPESPVICSEPYQPTNADVAQLVTELFAELLIAGVI